MSSSLYQQQLCSERQEIRTLTLKQGAFDDPIHCTLQTVSLADRPKYTALSYVWGDATDRLPIYVDGTLFSATKNLKIALQYIRKADRDQVMWVDAVCINQNDIDERNNSVSLMGELYSDADHVIIWLGEADDTTEELARVVQEPGIPTAPDPEDHDFDRLSMQHTVRIARLFILCFIVALRPWWRRVWTVQECILPRNDPSFQCGLQTFSCSRFFELYSKLIGSYTGIAQSIEFAEIPSVQDVLQYGERLRKDANQRSLGRNISKVTILDEIRCEFKVTSSISPIYCLLVSKARQATRPHDYLYGVLGLANASERMQVKIDYGRSHWAVYRDFFRSCFDTTKILELRFFAMASFHASSNELPSWVPDLTSQSDMEEYTSLALSSKKGFGSLKVLPSDDEDILMLQGLFLDVVDEVHAMKTAETETWWRHVLERAQLALEARHNLDRQESLCDRPPQELLNASNRTHISQLFLGSADVESENFLTTSQVEQHWDLLAEHQYAGKVFDNEEYKTSRAELGGISLRAFMLHLTFQTALVCEGRNLMFSRAGLSGICVPHAQPGDEIVCLYGFHILFILRPMHGHYRIIGAVHVPGLMDWSVLSRFLEEGKLHEATFRIR
jgi:hypothetical protein